MWWTDVLVFLSLIDNQLWEWERGASLLRDRGLDEDSLEAERRIETRIEALGSD